MNNPVRVRYAPSPTGFPHVGNIRTALFNWLFARHHGGSFIVRIEDTDVARTVPGALESILDSLRWLGLDWDEGPEAGGRYGPYVQSQRLRIYQELAQKLVAQGHAYYCYCSAQRLEEMRAEQARQKQPPGYDRLCRCLPAEQSAQKVAAGIQPVVRFKTLLEGQTRFQDLLRGDVVFENNVLDDFVLLKSDGYPTYHLANVIDDHLMEISHVLRAEEWLSSTPRHLMLYRALGFEPPVFAHMPMILGPDRSKLSKRHGATSLMEYRELGYLPEAMFNFLALLGWSLDDKTELFNRQELIANFSLERVSRTAAIFNKDKLNWMNGVYIRQLTVDDLAQRSMPFLEKALPAQVPRPLSLDYVKQVVPLIRERAQTLAEVPALTEFFFVEELDYAPEKLIVKGMTRQSVIEAFKPSQQIIETAAFDTGSLETRFRALAEELHLKAGQLFSALRIAITGRDVSPPLFQTMEVLGRERCRARIGAALEKLLKIQA